MRVADSYAWQLSVVFWALSITISYGMRIYEKSLSR